MKRTARHALALAAGLLLVHWPATASACAACMGDVNSKTAGAINAAIFLMIGVVGTMLASLAGFAFYLFKRAGAPLAPHANPGDSLNLPDDLT